MKAPVIISFCLIVAVATSFTQSFDTSDEAVLTDLVRGYGFCRGQKTSLDRIKQEFPDLTVIALRVEYQFASRFGATCDFFEKVVPDQTKNAIFAKYEEQTKGLVYTRPIVESFLNLVEKRSKGEVESPYLEALLTWHPSFRDAPELEFTKGFTKKYSSKDHAKAKGLHLEVSVPISWKAREGNRPNIVQFFKAKNGFSNISFTLMVKVVSLPGEKRLTQREVNEMFTARGIKELGQIEAKDTSGTLIEAAPIVLEGQKGGLIIIDTTVERLDQKTAIRMAEYIVYYDNRFIFLQFMNTGDSAKRSEWLREFEKNRKLFQLVANSLVIMDRY